MSGTIESTTDSKEDVLAAAGSLTAFSTEKDDTPAAAKDEKSEPAESTEESEPSDEELEGDDTEEDDLDEGDKKPKPKKSGFKRRIDKLSKKLADKDQEVNYWRQEAMRSKDARPAELTAPKAEKSVSQASEPNPDDFETHAEYIKAFTKFTFEQDKKLDEQKRRESEVQKKHQETVSTFQERLASFKDTTSDFEDVIEDVDDIEASMAVRDIILESENGPELMYELAKNREEFERINKLSPLAAARELGKIEARIGSAAKPEKTEKPEIKKSAAPPPIKPVSAKSSGSTKNPEDMTLSEYNKWREANG